MIDRMKLQAAHEAANEAQATVSGLEAALERSAAAVADAEAALHQAAVSGSEAAAKRLAELKSGDAPLTPLARIKRLTRFQCEEELELANHAHAALQSEMTIAKRKREIASDRLYWAAVAASYDFCEPLIAELEQVNARRHELRMILGGLTNHRNANNRPIDLREPEGLADALRDSAPNVTSPTAAMSERWAKRLDLLIADPDAEIDAPPAVTPDDAIFRPLPTGYPGNGGIFDGYAVR